MASIKLAAQRFGGMSLPNLRAGICHHRPMFVANRLHCFVSSSRTIFNTQREMRWNDPALHIPTLRLFSTMLSPMDDDPFPNSPIADMTNEELADTSTIPGWNLIHSPPRKYPRGALIGTVVSDKMDKTVNVAVVRHRIVPKIRKRLRYVKKFMAHDEQEVAKMGDTVMITPCHRISKNKHFMLREIVRPKGQI